MKHGLLMAGLLTFMACSSPHEQTYISDPNATEGAEILFQQLADYTGKVTLFGHQDAGVYGHDGWMYIKDKSDVKDVCGDHPAVYGWEIGHLEQGDEVSLDSVSFDKMRQMIKFVFRQGSINTISWHLRNPWNNHSAWDKTNGTVRRILSDKIVQKKYLEGLDRVADFLLSLKDDEGNFIPIIFRPFHEHTGSWFWWGSNYCTPEEYKELWRRSVTYLRDVRNIHHVLYIYSPDKVGAESEYMERYPGDEWVDILGLDFYHRGGTETAEDYKNRVSKVLDFIANEASKKNKPFVFSETGLSSITMDNWFTEVLYPVVSKRHPAYVLVWRNAYNMKDHFYAPYPGHASCNDFLKFKNKEDILFQDELRSYKSNK